MGENNGWGSHQHLFTKNVIPKCYPYTRDNIWISSGLWDGPQKKITLPKKLKVDYQMFMLKRQRTPM